MLPRPRAALSCLMAATNRRAFSAAPASWVVDTLKNAQCVAFDVDSTVITEEGIDVLAAHCGAGEAVAAWTAKAMGGSVKFEDALAARLELIKPSRSDIAECLAAHPPQLNAGVAELVELLHARGTAVYLVSGGFRLMINPVADMLDISHDRVFANTILFDEAGDFTGFDASEPTSADGGKPKVIGALKEQHGYDPVIMVGDGATDLQARPPADAFVGFGGIAVREVVKEGADWFVGDFEEVLKLVR